MAARDRIQHDENTRKKIKASQLINRLTNHALADEEVMTASQVNATKILLGKVLPDLKAMDIIADVEHNGEIHITWETPS